VPDAEQRLWRTVTRKKYQLRRNLVRLNNQLESLLEEAHIKLSSLVSDLLGVSARRMLKALADGETNPAALAALAHEKLRATPEQLCDALGACTELKPVYRRLLKMTLEHLQILEQQIGQLDQELATLLYPHQDAVERLAEVPGFAVDSAQQIIAEVGPAAATFPSEKCLSSWVGACPGIPGLSHVIAFLHPRKIRPPSNFSPSNFVYTCGIPTGPCNTSVVITQEY
jgi:transposase